MASTIHRLKSPEIDRAVITPWVQTKKLRPEQYLLSS